MSQASAAVEEALLRSVGILEARRIPYAVIGGLAAAVHGFVRPTVDVDLVLLVPTIGMAGLFEAFLASGYDVDLPKAVRAAQAGKVDLAWVRDRLLPLCRQGDGKIAFWEENVSRYHPSR